MWVARSIGSPNQALHLTGAAEPAPAGERGRSAAEGARVAGGATVEAPLAVRARFGHTEADPCGEADGLPIRASQLRVRAMNFGQHWRTVGVREVGYRVGVPVAFVVDRLDRELPDYVADCIAHPDTTPLESALRARGWPAAGPILDDPEVCGLALEWFGHDCLLGWLGDGEHEDAPGFVINSIESAGRRGGVVWFVGSGRAAGQKVRYQDA